MTGLEILRNPDTTTEQIVDIIAEHCPPVVLEHCDQISCRACWLAWLTTGEPCEERRPPDMRTTSSEEGLHPNLAERVRHGMQEMYKEQSLYTLIVDTIYEAIMLSKDSDIPLEQRMELLQSLPKLYRQRSVGQKIGRAHNAAITKAFGVKEFYSK